MQSVAETSIFTRQTEKLFTEDEKRELIDFLAENPLAGDEIPGTGGVRMYSDVEAYLKEMRVPPQVFEMMMLKSPEDMQVFEGDAVFSILPNVDPTMDERRTTFLAKRHGLDTLSYRRIRVQAESICAATFLPSDTQEDITLKVVVAGDCVEAYLWGVLPEQGEAMNALVRKSCILSAQDQKDFLSYKADVLMRALEGYGRDEMELDGYGFPPVLENNECVRRVYGR